MSFRSIQAQKLIDRTVNQPQYNYVLLQSEVSNNYDKNAFKVLAFDIFFNAKVEALKKVLEKGSIYEVEKQVQDLNQEKLCHVGYVNKDAARLLMNLLNVFLLMKEGSRPIFRVICLSQKPEIHQKPMFIKIS
jgi:hypothetical protein